MVVIGDSWGCLRDAREASVSVRALKSRCRRTAAMGSMMPFSKDITRDVPGLEVRAK
jgi:hypothetical protein